jgi:hypothetical protein
MRWHDVQPTLERAGYTVARRNDYYSPLPSIEDLRTTRARWDRPSSLRGLDLNLNEMEEYLQTLLARYSMEFSDYPPYEELFRIGFGPGFPAVDALTLYMVIRDAKPRHYVEVGSGLSTYYAGLAATRNAAEGRPMKITCIEPYPYDKLLSIPGISLIQKQVQDVGHSFFEVLQHDDLLFIDSSHILRIDGDVPFLLLEVLPSLPAGMLIHVHDIPFPYNVPYPPDLWVFGQSSPRFWNEAMVLQAFLAFNSRFRIVLSTPLIRHFNEGFLRRNVPGYSPVGTSGNLPSSIWLRAQQTERSKT